MHKPQEKHASATIYGFVPFFKITAPWGQDLRLVRHFLDFSELISI